MNKYKTIGIIGGQGPPSTADFYMRVVKYFQDSFGARYVRDFPPMIIYSVPTPDLVESIENEKETFMLVANAIKKLEQDGSDFIVIVCNSLQYLNEKFQPLIKIPIIGIASAVATHLKGKKFKTIGILATKTTIEKEIYKRPLEDMGITLLQPDEPDQQIISQIILDEMAGKTTTKNIIRLQRVISSLKAKGAQAILLACTELPLVIKQSDVDIPLIDSNEIYALDAAKRSSRK